MGLRRLLVSPEFLLRIEADPADSLPAASYQVTDLELASRLSFFLWSSIPDDELLTLAERGAHPDAAEVEAAVREGALLRVRPKAMTVAVILAGLLPILLGSGAGSEVMSRIAAPMIGGMLTAPLLSMFVLPAAYLLLRRPKTDPIPQPVSS